MKVCGDREKARAYYQRHTNKQRVTIDRSSPWIAWRRWAWLPASPSSCWRSSGGSSPSGTAAAARRRSSPTSIGRLEPARRYPLILAVLAELHLERGDELVDLFDKLLRYADSRARRRVDDQRRKTARQRDELAALARQLSRILVKSAATGELPMARIERDDRGIIDHLGSSAALLVVKAGEAVRGEPVTPLDHRWARNPHQPCRAGGPRPVSHREHDPCPLHMTSRDSARSSPGHQSRAILVNQLMTRD
jgi:hypothetical protein